MSIAAAARACRVGRRRRALSPPTVSRTRGTPATAAHRRAATACAMASLAMSTAGRRARNVRLDGCARSPRIARRASAAPPGRAGPSLLSVHVDLRDRGLRDLRGVVEVDVNPSQLAAELVDESFDPEVELDATVG